MLIAAALISLPTAASALGTGRAAGTPLTPPPQALDAQTCLSCHTTISKLHTRGARKKHLSKGDRNEENQTQPVVNKRFCSCLPLQPNSRERQDNARFPLPSHYLFRYLPEA